MAKNDHSAQEDITTQPYKGPSQAVAALGEGALQTKFLAIGGLIVGGVIAGIWHKPANKLIDIFNTNLEKLHTSPNKLVQPIGQFGKWFLSIGQHSVDWLKKFEFVQKAAGKLDEDRLKAVIDGAIITSTGASLIGTFSGGIRGAQSARAGKKQFEDAKAEILSLRKIVVDQETEMSDLKTAHAAQKGTLKVAGDDTVTVSQNDEAVAPEQKETPPAQSHADKLGAAPNDAWSKDISAQNAAKNDAQLAL